MLLSTLLFGALALAAPSALKPRMLKHDDDLAFGANGRVEVYQRKYFNELMANMTKSPGLTYSTPTPSTTTKNHQALR